MWRLFRNLWWYFWLNFFSNLPWHWCSLGSKKRCGKTFVLVIQFFFMGETWVDPFFLGLDFPFDANSRLAILILCTKKPLWDLILHCSKQHLASHGAAPKHVPGKKNRNSPDSTRKQKTKKKKTTKYAHNSAAPKTGIREVQVGLWTPKHEVKIERKGKERESEREREKEGNQRKRKKSRRGERKK